MAPENVEAVDAAFIDTCRQLLNFISPLRKLAQNDREEIMAVLEEINNATLGLEKAAVLWQTLKEKINKRNENDGN